MAFEKLLHRGHCFRCKQRWVLGRVDAMSGEYGQFYCVACREQWDDGDEEDESSAQEGGGGGEDRSPPSGGSTGSGESRNKRQRSRMEKGVDGEIQNTTDLETLAACVSLSPPARNLLSGGKLRVERMRVGGLWTNTPQRLLPIVCEHKSCGGREFKSCGASVWMGARILSNHLERCSLVGDGVKDYRVLEIGAGCGLPSMVAGSLGADVTVSDVAELSPLIECCVALNFPASVAGVELSVGRPPRFMPLDWESHEDRRRLVESGVYDLVIGADVGYDPQVFGALLETVQAALYGVVVATHETDGEGGCESKSATQLAPSPSRPRPPPRAVLALSKRDGGEFEEFCEHASSRGWSVRILDTVDLPELRGDPMCNPVAVVELRLT
eukprot:TRINITY_DN19525_c0_g1_i1.p1 TRINITY_DN19525_c0_g1~~TRINITY_DN19525_c0_g1_i1.p1  ORF type:complete len:424 (-),score=60.75 TRINITY_DN19525_c0_g1_i1:127-1278(-)